MKSVILAAGVSSRLRPLTDSVPKCLLDVGGETILGLTLENLAASGISDIIVVTGYRGGQIREYVHDEFPSMRVEYVVNDLFESTNNSYSFWLTRRSVEGEGILLLDSDIVFDRRIIRLLADSPHRTCLAMVRGTSLSDEEIKVQTGPGERVLRIGKDVPAAEAAGESIGIEKLSREFLAGLFRVLERKIVREKSTNLFYEAAFQDAIDEGAAMAAVDVGGLRCIEIDTPEDLESARAMAAMMHGASLPPIPPLRASRNR